MQGITDFLGSTPVMIAMGLAFMAIPVLVVGALVYFATRAGKQPSRRPSREDPVRFSPPAPAAVPALVAFVCPHCRATIQVPATAIGTTVPCGSCLRPFVPTLPPG